MIKKYYLKDLDVSQLPLPVREQINRGWGADCAPVEMVGYLENRIEPFQHSNGYKPEEYFTMWILSADHKIFSNESSNRYWFCVVKTPWVSPRIDKYLENILITKEGDL